MILSLMVFLVSMIIICIICHDKEISYPIILKLISLILIMYASITYIVKLTMYASAGYETTLYMLFHRIKIKINTLSLVSTIGTALYMLSGITSAFILEKKRRILSLLIPIVIFIVINHPAVMEKAYLRLIVLDNGYAITEKLRVFSNIYSTMALAFCIIYPYIITKKCYKKTNLISKKKEISLYIAIEAIADIIWIETILLGGMYRYMFWGISVLNYPISYSPLASGTIFVTTSLVASVAIIFLIFKFAPIISFFEKRAERVIEEETKAMAMIMHSYKNIFTTINLYASYKEEEYNFFGSLEKRMDAVKAIAEEQMEKLNSILKRYTAGKTGAAYNTDVELTKCIEQALTNSMATPNVHNIILNNTGNIVVFANKYNLTECLTCLINNACEAMVRKDGEKILRITTGIEGKNVYVEIYDNGCGIERKNMKKIFTPFFSTKGGAENYGIGLAYVKNAVETMGGSLNIKSKLGEYTKVQVVIKKGGK